MKNILNRLKTKNIIIYCATGYGEKICLCLVSMGFNVIGFCDNAKKNEGTFLLGLPVYNYCECRKRFSNAVYVVSHSNYAVALEIGMELEHDGYERNFSYFLSVELEYSNLLSQNICKGLGNILDNHTLVLFGDLFLCNVFKIWAKSFIPVSTLHICKSKKDLDFYRIQYSDSIWILLEKGVPVPDKKSNEKLIQILQEHHIFSYSRFFLYNMIYCEEQFFKKSTNKLLNIENSNIITIKKVVFLKTSSFSGSFFINSILDFHPQILYLGYTGWSMNIWHIVKNVINIPRQKLSEEIINIIKKYEGDLKWLKEYSQILDKYFQYKQTYSERDIFIIIHLAHYELLHGTLPKNKELIIYMDIHSNMIMRDSIFSWLDKMEFSIVLLEIIRLPYKRLGSMIKYVLGEQHMITSNWILNALHMCSCETIDETEKKYPIIRIRFEDVKMFPKEVLGKMCNLLEIAWSDTLMETTLEGNKSTFITNDERVTGFDLKPVYNSYDDYFDYFDKFRLDCIFREKNKAYGYPFTTKDKYPVSINELEKIFLTPFRFEQYMSFKDDTDIKTFHKKLQMLAGRILYLEENTDIYNEYFQFGQYLKIGESS